MKQINRIWIYPVILLGLILMLAISCKKGISPDYASEIEGTYVGNVTKEGSVLVVLSSNSILTRISNKEVDLEIKISRVSIPLNGIDVDSSDDDIYDLKYTDSIGSFTGKVKGNRLTWTMTADTTTDTFDGTK